MNLDETMRESIRPTPVENAHHRLVEEFGQQYDIVTTPILNPSPRQQVALQQVSSRIPDPIFHYDEIKPLPDRTWIFQEWKVDFKDGVMTVSEKVERPILFFFRHTKKLMRKELRGRDIHQRFLTWMTDSRMSSDAKTFFRTAMVHHVNSQKKRRESKSPLGKTVIQPIHTSNDMVAAVEPTGLINADYYNWAQSVESLPDF